MLNIGNGGLGMCLVCMMLLRIVATTGMNILFITKLSKDFDQDVLFHLGQTFHRFRLLLHVPTRYY